MSLQQEPESCFKHSDAFSKSSLHMFPSLLQECRDNPTKQIIFGELVTLPCFPRQTEGLFHEIAPKGTQSMIVKQHGVHLYVVAAACTSKHLVVHRIKLTREVLTDLGEELPLNCAVVHPENLVDGDHGPEMLKIQPVALVAFKRSGGILRLETLRETQNSLYFTALKEGGLIEVWHLRAGAIRLLHRYQAPSRANITFLQPGSDVQSSTNLLVTKQKSLHWVSLGKRTITECQPDWKISGTPCDKLLEGIDKFCWYPHQNHLLLVGARSCLMSGRHASNTVGTQDNSKYESKDWQPLVLEKELSPGISRLKVFNVYTHREKVAIQIEEEHFEVLEINMFLLVSGLSMRVALFTRTAVRPPLEFLLPINFAKVGAPSSRAVNLFDSLSLEDASILFVEPQFSIAEKFYTRSIFVQLVHAGQLTIYKTELAISVNNPSSVTVKDCIPVRVFPGFEVQANILHKTLQIGVLQIGDRLKCRNRKWIVAGSGRSNNLVLIPIYF